MCEMGDLVLVTGATGYIAAHIIQQLLRQGYRVRGTVRDLNDEQKVNPVRALAEDKYAPNLELVQADLLDSECWPRVVEGCKFVMHTASPFPKSNPKHEDDLIKPAVDGTLNVLRGCGPDVKRVVLTSSVAAIHAGHKNPPNGKAFTEDDWTITDKVNMVYEKSKALAERAAWDYIRGLPNDRAFEMAVINPALVIGPVISGGTSTSVSIIARIMSRSDPMLPRLNFSVVDVRDVAKAHIVALESAEALGQRHIVSGPNLWFKDIAVIIEKEFKSMGYNVPTTNAPYFILWFLGRCDASIRMILPAVEETIIDCCYSLVDVGIVKKTAKYKSNEQP